MANYTNSSGQIRLGWRTTIVTQVVNSVDADATAFITAAGITDLTQAAAINTLVNDLKTYGIWSKMKAIYPFVGGSATSHKFNLKDPRDLDDAYRLVFNGGWVHSSTGAKPNGTTGYANTKLIPVHALTPSNGHLSIYSRTNISENGYDMGVTSGNNYDNMIASRYGNNKFYSNYGAMTYPTIDNTDSRGLFITNRNSSTNTTGYKNGINLINSSQTGGVAGLYVAIGALNNDALGITNFSSKEQAFASIGDGLSDVEAVNFYNSVQKFQTTLGRQVGTPTVSDLDAQAFLNVAGITDSTQASAVNTLVTDLKAAGVWTKMKAIYPFVGGTATSHKFNLKDPRDVDAAFRLAFNGGWTHTNTGALPNGTTGYANTFLIPSSTLTNYSSHLSFYSRTNRGSSRQSASIGSYLSPNEISLRFNFTAATGNLNNTSMSAQYDGNGLDFATYPTSTTNYFLIGNRTANNINKIYENGILKSTNTITTTKLLPSARVLIGALSDGNTNVIWYDNLESTFASIGDGLTDNEATTFYTAVQKFQTTLGRQVGSPIVSDSDAQSFLNVAGITDLGQATAVNTLVTDLKAAGVWTKMKAVYPFVGGSATSHKWNLKDPRDLDAAYRLQFNGGWTHTGTGALPNGTTGYANTFFNPYSVFAGTHILPGSSTFYLSHFSKYSRNNVTISPRKLEGVYCNNGGGGIQFWNMGWDPSVPNGSGILNGSSYPNGNAAVTLGSRTDGFFTINRDGFNSLKSFRNGSLVSTNTTDIRFWNEIGNQANTAPNQVFLIGARNDSYDGTFRPYGHNDFETTFQSFGYSLTDTEASAFYTAVQKFQTSLGRQIGTPVLESTQTANLLDTYSSAVAAYSLRKLRTGYYGFAIRVRRSSDNLEQDISFKADGTLDTTSLLSFVGNGDGFVTIWYDQSGNGYNVSHTTTFQQPEIVSSGSLITNLGKVSIRFGLVSGGVTYLQNSSLSLNTPDITIIYIGNKINSGNSQNAYSTPISLRTPSTQDWNYINNIGTRMVANGNIGLQYNSTMYTQTYSFNTSYLMWNQKINNYFSVGKNGNTLSTSMAASSANITSSLLVLGGTQYNADSFLNGYLSEVIIYPSNQSSNRNGIESNINSYYSIF